MSITILKNLDSETVTIPEAAALVGKRVRITIEEETPIADAPRLTWGGKPFDADALMRAFDAAREAGVDFDDEAMAELDRVSTL